MRLLIDWLRPRDQYGALLVGPFDEYRPIKLMVKLAILLS